MVPVLMPDFLMPRSVPMTRAVHVGGKFLADHLANVEADQAIGQAEEIDKVPPTSKKGVKRNAISMQ
jgi:hypothetical protein